VYPSDFETKSENNAFKIETSKIHPVFFPLRFETGVSPYCPGRPLTLGLKNTPTLISLTEKTTVVHHHTGVSKIKTPH
jgi:hypothetical protein